ncbi:MULTISPECIES: winged helix-turn-helix domain-containing protein [Metallosphaera]|uniref:N-terminal domain of molybdenum-binding protein-like protein n=3 Tax=Metallosphaera TaxID=41980 RepID=A4YGQ5_METS5|nr:MULTISPECIES: LysR family transcriptional regulator [Metallosphaera]ABP95607.1 N-terminal domain of molybdenum-binding protein-like protein [Metallosphaera sedula DSM 5348]AIM27591.1 N-terminal domain of molybdenum-binding protein-like protein [Metallosphaera sedula]AKV74452.1 DNA-binding protein [Metallosphaera sedula]AKV76691.1 DNA-binding protein [Metallosphaera sedula]AKV78942.1 DNA-binding protein [Metallosphaera sedula]
MKFNFKIWIEDDEGKPVMGKGGVALVKAIVDSGSIAKASEEMKVSYKFAWQYVRRINGEIGGIQMKKGGKNAGGTNIDPKVIKAVRIYEQAQEEVRRVLEKYSKMLEEEMG